MKRILPPRLPVKSNAKQVHQNPEAWLPWNYTQKFLCSYVNVSICPKEGIYKHSPSDPPIISPISALAVPERKTLTDHCRDFFRSLHPKKPKKISHHIHVSPNNKLAQILSCHVLLIRLKLETDSHYAGGFEDPRN